MRGEVPGASVLVNEKFAGGLTPAAASFRTRWICIDACRMSTGQSWAAKMKGSKKIKKKEEGSLIKETMGVVSRLASR
jgi:hypothetical protein